MGDPPRPVPEPNRLAHRDLHALVTASLNGYNEATLHQLIATTDHPRTVLAAAVHELTVLTQMLADACGRDAPDMWADICAQWERSHP